MNTKYFYHKNEGLKYFLLSISFAVFCQFYFYNKFERTNLHVAMLQWYYEQT